MTVLACAAAYLAVSVVVGVLLCKGIRRGDERAGITRELQDADQAAWLARRGAR